MSAQKLIRPKPEPSFFIGWDGNVPKVDRRTMLASAIGLVAVGGGAGVLLAREQNQPGVGDWDQADVRAFAGVVSSEPYPLLRTADLGGGVRTALLACMTKCGVSDRLSSFSANGGRAVVTGTLIQRGRHAMIAVVDDAAWIRSADTLEVDASALEPTVRSMGSATLRGEILDTKCWYGAMRPNDGKVHKACASLCIRSGLPPAFYARDAGGEEYALLLTDPDGAGIILDEAFLALVADPAEATGEIVAVGDLLQFRVDPSAIRRI